MPVVFPCCNIPFVLLSSFTVSVCIATSYCQCDGPEEETRYACLVYFSCDYIQTLLYHVISITSLLSIQTCYSKQITQYNKWW